MNILPPEVDCHWHQEKSGQTVYVFSHPTLGSLGRLSIIPHLGKTRMVWEPVGEYLQSFVQNLIEEATYIFSPMKYYSLPCSHCNSTIARLLHFPEVQDFDLLKACASYYFGELDLTIPIWIMGEGIALETLWPIRKIFRAVSLDELSAAVLAFQSAHCCQKVKFLH